MNRNQKLTLVLTAVLTLGVGDAAAQDEERRRGPRGVIDVEGIMSMRERLELDDAQMDELEAWRVERLARVSEERARMDEMRSRLRAGQIERSEMMTHMQERRDALFRSRSDSRSRLEGILNERQLQTFDGVVRERRAFARGRASAGRGGRPGMRGGRPDMRGGRPGMRGGRPGMRGGRTGMRGGRPGMRGGRPGMRGDRPGMRLGPRGDWGGPGWQGPGPGNGAGADAPIGSGDVRDPNRRIEAT